VTDEKGDVDSNALALASIEVLTNRPRPTTIWSAERGRHPLPQRTLRIRLLRQRLEVGVEVDESRRDDAIGGVNDATRTGGAERSARNESDTVAIDRDVGPKASRPGAVNDGPVPDEDVVGLGAGLRRPWWRASGKCAEEERWEQPAARLV
jgi:hypothetical protein